MAHKVSSVGFGLVHPSPMDLGTSPALRCLHSVGQTRALLIPPFCHPGRSGWPFWSPGTSWMGMARFVLFSVEQEAFSSFFLQGCFSGHLFTVILLQHFSLQGEMLAPACLGQGSVAGLWAAHWPIAPTFPLGFQFLLISFRKLFKCVPVSRASALPVLSCSWSGPSAEEALLFAMVQSTPR